MVATSIFSNFERRRHANRVNLKTFSSFPKVFSFLSQHHRNFFRSFPQQHLCFWSFCHLLSPGTFDGTITDGGETYHNLNTRTPQWGKAKAKPELRQKGLSQPEVQGLGVNFRRHNNALNRSLVSNKPLISQRLVQLS